MTTHISPDRQPGKQSGLAYGLINRIVIFLLLIFLTFLLPRLMPGDPIDMLISADVARELTQAERDDMHQQMGLNDPILEQFVKYCAAILQGDLGHSIHHAASVTDLLLKSLPWTGLLIVGSMPIFLLAGVGLGLEAGRSPHSYIDRALTLIVTFLASIPPFAIAVFLLALLGFVWPIFPTSGAQPIFPSSNPLARFLEILHHAILPAFALAMHEIVRFYFTTRGEAIKLSVRPFMTNAKARGIDGWRERIHYYGRNLLPVILARMSDSLSMLVSTVLYVEIIFSYPGIGHLMYNAILERDFVLLQGVILGLSALILTMNWLIDLSIAILAERG